MLSELYIEIALYSDNNNFVKLLRLSKEINKVLDKEYIYLQKLKEYKDIKYCAKDLYVSKYKLEQNIKNSIKDTVRNMSGDSSPNINILLNNKKYKDMKIDNKYILDHLLFENYSYCNIYQVRKLMKHGFRTISRSEYRNVLVDYLENSYEENCMIIIKKIINFVDSHSKCLDFDENN